MSNLYIPSFKYIDKTARRVSYFGYFVFVIGAMVAVIGGRVSGQMPETTENLIAAIAIAGMVGGPACMGYGWLRNRKAVYEKLVAEIDENNLQPVLKSSVEQCAAIYRRLPVKKMERYLAFLNPEAGDYIAAHRGELRRKIQ